MTIKRRPERDRAKLARVAHDVAMNEGFHPDLRSYYARLALWADKRAKKELDESA